MDYVLFDRENGFVKEEEGLGLQHAGF